MLTAKSNAKAEIFRAKGFGYMQEGELYEALLRYNKSLCFAEPSTKTVGLIYANRAEVFFKLKLYEKCLNNIQLAREECCPPGKLEFLDELQEKCLNRIDDVPSDEVEDPWEFFKLSYPANEKLPHVIDCLEVKCDKKYGRYIISNQNLNVGDIIAIEKPLINILKVDPDDDEYPSTNVYQYCANCLEDNLMDLIPCQECTTTLFCSTTCYEAANKSFHQYECNILHLLNETGNWRMTFRCFFNALSICNGSIDELEQLMAESDSLSPTVFNFDFSNPKNPDNAKNQLLCLMALTRKVTVSLRNFSDIFQHHPKLIELWSTHKEFINKFLKRLMQIEILNFHGIKGRALDQSNPYRSCVGDGGYAFCSLLNHSCCSNLMRIVVENRMVLIVERPIKKGDQLFDCYIGDSFYFKKKNSRREELLDYQFVCDCDACEHDFPEMMTGDLETLDKVLHTYAQKAYNELRDPRKIMSTKEAKELAVKYSNIMQRNYREQNYPCREIVLLELCIIKCFLTACKSSVSFP